MKIYLVWASVIFGFLAAALWFCATFVVIPYKMRFKKDGTPEPAVTEEQNGGKEIDVFLTAKRQTKWNRYAAFATGVSGLCQAVSLMLK